MKSESVTVQVESLRVGGILHQPLVTAKFWKDIYKDIPIRLAINIVSIAGASFLLSLLGTYLGTKILDIGVIHLINTILGTVVGTAFLFILPPPLRPKK